MSGFTRNSVLVFEPSFNTIGHRSYYLKLLRDSGYGFKYLGAKVQLDDCPSHVDCFYLDRPVAGAFNQLKFLDGFKDKDDVSEIIHTWLDPLIIPLFIKSLIPFGKGVSTKVGGLLFLGTGCYERKFSSRVKLYFLGVILKRVVVCSDARFLFVNQGFARYLKARYPLVAEKFIECPDPIVDYSSRQQFLDVRSSKRRNILLMGVHSPRKGTHWFVEQIANSGLDLSIKIIGRVDLFDELVAAASMLPSNIAIEINNSFVSESEMLGFYDWADVVVLPYFGFGGSSGILAHAVSFRKPVLVSDFGLIGDIVRNGDFGLTFNQGDSFDLLRKLELIIDGKVEFYKSSDRTIFMQKNSVNAFVCAVLNLDGK